MDKTYNDLMDIVNRTKKMKGGEDIPKVTKRVRREEPMDEAVVSEKVIKSVRDLDEETKPSLFADKSAINKLLNTPKTKKKSTAKTKKSEDDEKTTTKKSAEKKTTTKKSTTKKDSTTTSNTNSTIDYNDPKNAQLLDALKGTLLAGGTDISEYVDDDKFENTANTLKALKEKKKTEIINEEITKEQQEYEKLFTGSFFSEEDIKTEDEEDENPDEVLESAFINNKFETTRQSVKEKRLDSDLEEIKSRDMEIDRKIADYYKQKQEKINKYNEALYNDVEQEEKIDSYEEKQRSYEDVFSGEIVSRSELMGENTEEVQENPEIEENETVVEKVTTVSEQSNDEEDRSLEDSSVEGEEQSEVEDTSIIDKMFAFSEEANENKTNETSTIEEVVTEEENQSVVADNEESIRENDKQDQEETVEVVATEEDNVEEIVEDKTEEIEKQYPVDKEETEELSNIVNEQVEESQKSVDTVEEDQSYADIFNKPMSEESTIDTTEDNSVAEVVETVQEEQKENSTEVVVNNEEKTQPEIIEESPIINEEDDNRSAKAFVDSVEESIYSEEDDYSNYDDEELDRTTLNRKATFTEEDIAKFEQNDEDYIISMEQENNGEFSKYDELDDYIVSSNIPDEINEEEPPMQEYIAEDNSLVLDTRALPESQIDVLGQEIEKSKEENSSEETQEEPQEESDSISKEEFYNEMARLQQNLINELKGQKVETVSKDFFEEKQPEKVAEPDNSTINKALDIINNLTNKPVNESSEQEVEKVNTEEKVDIVPENSQEKPEEIIDETVVEEEIEEPIDPEQQEKFDSMDLLGKEVALNNKDLEFFNESQKPKDIEKDAYFYMSDEDKTKKAEFEDEYLTMYNEEEEGHNVEVGDINLNKDIQNAVPLSELFKNRFKGNEQKNEENSEEEMETIYTLFGMERKKMGKQKEDIKVLYVASECQPFIATGGLADVAGSLPKAIAEIGGVDIRVILPLYGNIKNEYRDKFEYLGNFTVHLSWRQEYCGLFRYSKDGVTYYFIDNERYFKREKTYGYYDDGERFAYFCKAIVESLPIINFFPDIIHCNDWQSSLVSAYIKTGNWSDHRYYQIKNIYTIHNVEYQGVYGMENLKDLFGIDFRFRNDMDYNGDINLTKAAIQYSDKFTTVSESYCDNLKQPYCSRGLHHIIIRNDYKLSGIINGIDYDFYNPETDKIIYKNYTVDTLKDKVMNKKIWQDELGLPVDARTPMLAIVSRLVSHKGLDLLSKVIEDILQKDIQLVVVGTGDQRFVDYYKYLESKYPTKVRAMVDAFSSELARKAYAASDIFLMPSKIEPCGISQMIASRYGSIPIVREVGGLKDSIKDFGCESGGNGYTFTNYNPNDLSYQINRAIEDYEDQANWEKKMKIAMTTDFRWSKSAEKYIELYKSLT